MGHRVTLIDWDHSRSTVARVDDKTRKSTGCEKRHDGWVCDKDVLSLETFEQNLDHALPGASWIRAVGLSYEDTTGLIRCAPQLVVKGVMPNMLNIVPVPNDTACIKGTAQIK